MAAKAFLMQAAGGSFGLSSLYIELQNLRDRAQDQLRANHDDETACEALAYIYTELPRVSAELLLLSEGTIGERVAWLEADEETHREMTDRILLAGGLRTFNGKWAEVHWD